MWRYITTNELCHRASERHMTSNGVDKSAHLQHWKYTKRVRASYGWRYYYGPTTKREYVDGIETPIRDTKGDWRPSSSKDYVDPKASATNTKVSQPNSQTYKSKQEYVDGIETPIRDTRGDWLPSDHPDYVDPKSGSKPNAKSTKTNADPKSTSKKGSSLIAKAMKTISGLTIKTLLNKKK